MKQRNKFITMWEKAGARERYAMGHEKTSLFFYVENGHEYQDANGATYDQTRGAWIN